MEECWNYMNEESHAPKPSVDPSQPSLLNPDANEFKPSWSGSSNNANSSNEFKEAARKF